MEIIFIVISLVYIFPSDSRLIQRNTNKPIEVNTTSFTPPTRITRSAFNQFAVGFSREDDQSNEYLETKAVRIPAHHEPKAVTKSSRFVRSSNENINEGSKNASSPKSQSKTRDAMVNKPIPKFHEIDYDDDFQLKVLRSPTTYNQDSSEHEDEDFNLDDYDFDVNHDEFSGRGKPLEPRVKSKNMLEKQNLADNEPDFRRIPASVHNLRLSQPVIHSQIVKTQSKVVQNSQKVISKRDHDDKNDKVSKKTADKMNDDFYDDFTTTKVPERKVSEVDDDFTDDHSDSNEYDRKSIRYVRSPYGSDSLKTIMETSKLVSRLTGVLPLFPSQSITI